jgi:hypothetical protein
MMTLGSDPFIAADPFIADPFIDPLEINIVRMPPYNRRCCNSLQRI